MREMALRTPLEEAAESLSPQPASPEPSEDMLIFCSSAKPPGLALAALDLPVQEASPKRYLGGARIDRSMVSKTFLEDRRFMLFCLFRCHQKWRRFHVEGADKSKGLRNKPTMRSKGPSGVQRLPAKSPRISSGGPSIPHKFKQPIHLPNPNLGFLPDRSRFARRPRHQGSLNPPQRLSKKESS